MPVNTSHWPLRIHWSLDLSGSSSQHINIHLVVLVLRPPLSNGFSLNVKRRLESSITSPWVRVRVCVCVKCVWSYSLFAAVYMSENHTHSYASPNTHTHTDVHLLPWENKWDMGRKRGCQRMSKNPIDQFIHKRIYKLQISLSPRTQSAFQVKPSCSAGAIHGISVEFNGWLCWAPMQ